jgi:hypothetical protein
MLENICGVINSSSKNSIVDFSSSSSFSEFQFLFLKHRTNIFATKSNFICSIIYSVAFSSSAELLYTKTEVKWCERGRDTWQITLNYMKISKHPLYFWMSFFREKLERERNPSIRTPAKNVKVHENLISKACLSLSFWLLPNERRRTSECQRKGKVKFIFGLFCGCFFSLGLPLSSV